MDIESDDSERWEDFFGSSTDLTPSLISLYDSLTGSLNLADKITVEEDNNHNKLQQKHQQHSHKQSLPSPSSNISFNTAFTTTITSTTTEIAEIVVDKLICDSANFKAVSFSSQANIASNNSSKNQSFRVLSPNVQRLISHSVKTVVGKNATKSTQSNIIKNRNNNISSSSGNFIESNNRCVRKISGKHKLSLIPLSRNTCKLTQAGNELVETFESNNQSSCESLGCTSNLNKELKIDRNLMPNVPIRERNVRTTTTPVTTSGISKVVQNLYPPTQEISQDSNIINHASSKQQKCHFSSEIKSLDKLKLPDENVKDINSSISNNSSTNNTAEAVSKSQPTIKLNESVACVIEMSVEDTSSIVENCRSPSSQAATSTLASTATVVTRTITNNNKSSITPSQRTSYKLSTKNLDNLTGVKSFSSSATSMEISSTLKSNRKSSFILHDVANLKHRPLSSSSVCSTSSSSSSGSENLVNGKLNVSYLARVESLADRTENELLDDHDHNFTVFERACLEIIDSERSYVEDLRQVITGYLEDWKERACLKLDELKVLFSNIQDIFDFNSILLKRLLYSGMDPIKIAKCFIKLKDHFGVYTTYCTSYPEAISLLTSLLQASHTNALLTSTQKMLQHTLPLGSYLLKPVQRILKYHLLLDNLRKHCDTEQVIQAHDIMRQVARNIDQVKKQLEQHSRVKELSGILDGWLGPAS